MSHTIGLSEQELRDELEQELLRSMHAEGDAPTVHAIAHSVARLLVLDHLRIAAHSSEPASLSMSRIEATGSCAEAWQRRSGLARYASGASSSSTPTR